MKHQRMLLNISYLSLPILIFLGYSSLLQAQEGEYAVVQEEEPEGDPAGDNQLEDQGNFFVEEETENSQTVPPEGAVDESYFFEALAPYGEWMWTAEYGWVWHPNGVSENFRPYTYGRWVMTEYGWTFVSYYEWGWAPFHYGRWALMDYIGWVWVPGTVWAPAWVMWRYSDGYIGWSPLLAGYDFWYGWAYYPVYYNHWIFVGWDHFCDEHPDHYYVPHNEVSNVFRHSYYPRRCRDKNSAECGRGPARDFVEQHTKTSVPLKKINNLAVARPGQFNKNKLANPVDGDVLNVYRPKFKKSTPGGLVQKRTGVMKSKDLGTVYESPKTRQNIPSDSTTLHNGQFPSVQSQGTLHRGEFQKQKPIPGQFIEPKQPKTHIPTLPKSTLDHSPLTKEPSNQQNFQMPNKVRPQFQTPQHSTPNYNPHNSTQHSVPKFTPQNSVQHSVPQYTPSTTHSVPKYSPPTSTPHNNNSGSSSKSNSSGSSSNHRKK